MNEEIKYNCIPPILTNNRNEFGLLKNVNYEFDERGFVKWRRLIRPEHLYVNKHVFEQKKVAVPTSIEGLKDEELFIKLAGIREVASIRGFHSIDFEIKESHPTFAAAKVNIRWIGNYETEMCQIETSDGADAHTSNCIGLGLNYLTAMACNRAFIRCVRNFLSIPILGEGESTQNIENPEQEKPTTPMSNPRTLLANLFKGKGKNKGKDFAWFKEKAIKDGVDGADKWESIDDIPTTDIFGYIDKIQTGKSLKG